MNETYEFGPFVVDSARRLLLRGGNPISLSNKAFDVLIELIRERNRVVEKEELLSRVWPDTVVEENNLTVAVSALRKALGEELSDRRYVVTVPGHGYRFAADVRVVKQSERESVPKASKERPRRDWPWAAAATGIAVLIVVGILAYWRLASPPMPQILNYTQITNDGADKLTVLSIGAIQPPMVTDGSRIYFTEEQHTANGVIAQVSVGGGATAVVPTPFRNVAVNGISPSGSDLLAYTWQTNELRTPLWLFPVLGGTPRQFGETTQDASWLADGRIVYTLGHDIFIAKNDGSGSRKLATIKGLPVWPRMSPNGKAFRFTELDPQSDSTSLWEVSADGSGLHPLLAGWANHGSECCGNWTPDGKYFVFQSTRSGRTDLWILRDRGLGWHTKAEPVQLTAGPLSLSLPLPSKDGARLFAMGSKMRGELVRYDPTSGQFVPYLGGISALDVVVSPDGNSVAYVTFPDGDLWQSRMDGTRKVQLTFLPMEVHAPRWSPDGTQIAFMGRDPGKAWRIYLVPAEGAREPKPLGSSNESQTAPDWSLDGRSLVFSGLPEEMAGNSDATAIHVIDLHNGAVSTLPGSIGLYCPRWSPTGRYISATSSDGSKLMLFDLRTQQWSTLISIHEGCPVWSRNGEYLYFQTLDVTIPEFSRVRVLDGKQEHVASIDFRRGGQRDWYWWNGLTPDGNPVVLRNESTEEIYALDWKLP